MDSELQKHYELGYHISMNVEEGRVAQVKDEIEKLVTTAGGTITFSQAPERRRLSYSIHHQRQAYFGWLQFSLPKTEDEDPLVESEERPNVLTQLDEQLRLNNDILRYILLKLEHEEDKRTAPLAASRERKAAAQAAKPRPTDETKAKDSGKLEEELDEALENL